METNTKIQTSFQKYLDLIRRTNTKERELVEMISDRTIKERQNLLNTLISLRVYKQNICDSIYVLSQINDSYDRR